MAASLLRSVDQLARARGWREADLAGLSLPELYHEIARYHYDLVVDAAQKVYALDPKERRKHLRALARSTSPIDRYAAELFGRWEREL